jgi:hypothetical protein
LISLKSKMLKSMTGTGGFSSKLLTAMVVAICSTAALADGNSVYIDQTNADNSTVSITQTGQDNKVGDPNSLTAPSFVIDGNAMNLTIIQDGMGNSITGNFIGGDSTANINQTGDFNTSVLNFGNSGSNGGTLDISIIGNSNATTLNVGTTASANNYYYQLNIGTNGINGSSSNSNAVTSSINSVNASTTIKLSGGNSNVINTAQSGGSGHIIDLNVIGGSNTVGITQDGVNANSAIVNITGSGTTTSIIQH